MHVKKTLVSCTARVHGCPWFRLIKRIHEGFRIHELVLRSQTPETEKEVMDQRDGNPMELHIFYGKIHGFRVRFSLEPFFIDGKRHRTLVYHNFYDLEWSAVWDKPTQPWQWKIIFTNKIVFKIGNVPLRKGNKTLLRNEQSLCVIMEKVDGCRARKIASNGDQK